MTKEGRADWLGNGTGVKVWNRWGMDGWYEHQWVWYWIPRCVVSVCV